jgi:hypothetical protein
MLLDIRDGSTATSTREIDARNAAQLLVNVCIAFAILETFFIIVFILSWHTNKDNNSNNTKGVYALILAGYVFCFGGVVIGIRESVCSQQWGWTLMACSETHHGRSGIPCAIASINDR